MESHYKFVFHHNIILVRIPNCVRCLHQHHGLDYYLPRCINRSETKKLLGCGKITALQSWCCPVLSAETKNNIIYNSVFAWLLLPYSHGSHFSIVLILHCVCVCFSQNQ